MDKLLNTRDVQFTKVLQQNIDELKKCFEKDETVIYREFESGGIPNIKFYAVYVAEMVDKKLLNQFILEPLMRIDFKRILEGNNKKYRNIADLIMKKVINSTEISATKILQEAVDNMFNGDTVVFIEGCEEALIINTKGFPTRATEEPESEKVIKGPREGFNENLETNLSFIRRRIKTTKLKFIFMEIGANTKTRLCICYIEDIASERILQELINRIKNIKVGEILYSNSISEYIKDSPFTLFETIGDTERPDVLCGKLLEGKIGVFVDGTPFALTIPYLFNEYFQSPDDYTNNYLFSSFNRILRLIAFFMGISVPALYTAVISFHQELIPTPLLLSIAMAREGLPFPTLMEAITMLFGFDLLREAGVRLPKPVGQTVSIVGALVLGEAAVNARIVSAPMVIIVAVTGISSFLVPRMLAPFTILRMIFLIISGFIGLYGYCICCIGLVIYLMSLRSFGVTYMLYSKTINQEDIKDTIVRMPWFMLYYRDKFSGKNYIRRDGIKGQKNK